MGRPHADPPWAGSGKAPDVPRARRRAPGASPLPFILLAVVVAAVGLAIYGITQHEKYGTFFPNDCDRLAVRLDGTPLGGGTQWLGRNDTPEMRRLAASDWRDRRGMLKALGASDEGRQGCAVTLKLLDDADRK